MLKYTHDNACDVPMIPISGHLTPWSVDGWVIESRFVQGGYVVVPNLTERNKLTDDAVYEDRSALVHGSPVYVASEKKTYRWNADTQDWDEDETSTGNIEAELSNYYNKAEVDSKLESKASNESVDELTAKFNDYYNKSQVEDLVSNVTVDLSSYYTKTEVDDKLANVSVDLTNYYTKEEVTQVVEDSKVSLDGYATEQFVTEKVSEIVVPTKVSELENDADYLTAIPAEYVTESELNSKGYLTEHQDISGKAERVHTHTLSEISDYEAPDLTPYAKTEDIPDTSSFITKDVSDLTNYYTKETSDLATTFGDVITTVEFGGVTAGTSLKGKSIKEVLEMILGVEAAPQPAVEFIMENSIPAYSGTANTSSSVVNYQQLDTKTATFTDQGFYVTTAEDGTITNAGYQLTFTGNSDMDAQTFAVPANANIIKAYQYDDGGTREWLEYEFPGSYWVEGDNITETVNGNEVEYQTYSYNVDDIGDAIASEQYWRFEIEVNN